MLYIFLALCAALGFSISDICSKYLLDNGVSNLQYIFWVHGIFYVIFTALSIYLASKYAFNQLTNGRKYMSILKFPEGILGVPLFLAAFASFCGLIALIYAFKISANIGYTSAIVGTTSLITFFFSWIFFKKTPKSIGLLGAIFILFGVYLISKCDN
mgnify:FL=1